MQKRSKNFEYCIKLTLDNAIQRINILEKLDKESVLEENKEWINIGLNNHKILYLREDPII